ncbi:bis(5'-nucleosyl)-tetraphosphatase (symmetrical) YqeK [Chryseomicrobium palamuruense]|uniref:bis(5'-nucleosyl)-tetraphosphatase (symmetrical) n=1 Tax=Chryseomicrobium palamuruense TaxID=682973 RepID=A0ABV8UXL7_9BACL
MTRDEILKKIRPRMKEKRFLHTIGVADTAMKLAEQSGMNPKNAELAGLLHDVCKYANLEWMAEQIQGHALDPRLLDHHHELWHGPVGSLVAKYEFGVHDEDVLNAIKYHTTGRIGMSKLEKIIYVADMIEPSRDFPNVDELREKTFKDIEIGMKYGIRHTIQFLVMKKQVVFPDSFECYNDCWK